MSTRQAGPTFGIVAFRTAYWALAALMPLVLLWVVPAENTRLVFNELTVILYLIAAGALYRLLLLFAVHATGSDAVEREIRESEGRVELKLDDRDDGWGA